MGDARGQLTDGGQLLRLQQLGVRLRQLLDQLFLAGVFGQQRRIGGLQIGGTRCHLLFELIARLAQRPLRLLALGHIVETEDAPHHVIGQILGSRTSLEQTSIAESQDILGLLGIDNLVQSPPEYLAIDQPGGDEVQDCGIVASTQQGLGDAPHSAEQAIHVDDAAMPIDHQDAVAGGFQRRPQLRQGLGQILLGLAFRTHVARLDEQ